MNTETQNQELPTYVCHKKVQASKITGVPPCSGNCDGVDPFYIFTEHGAICVNESLVSKIKIEGDDFGYYVKYADGYESWSPTKAFEDGYSLYQPESETVDS